MDNLLSGFLTELTLNGKTEFIDASKNTSLIALAKTRGITLPDPDLAMFETVFCSLDVPNLNKVMLSHKVAAEGLKTIVGKNVNINHMGKHYVMGYIIDAKIQDDSIVISGILFKSLFGEEFNQIKDLFAKGKLFVSFELWSKSPETKESFLDKASDGISIVNKMIAHGVGILINGVKPACKNAKALKLLANAKESEENLFEENEMFAFAKLSQTDICNSCSICECKKEDNKVDELLKKDEIIPEETKEAASTEVIAPAETNLDAQKKKKLCSKCNEEMPEDEKDEVCSKCKKIKAEEVVVTPAEVVVAQPIVEKKLVKTIEEITAIRTVTYVDGGDIIESKTVRKTTNEYNDGTKSEILNDVEVKDTYIFTQAQLDEAIANAKTEKDLEIATLKEANDKLLKEKSDELIASQTKFDSDLKISNEEIVTLKAQVGDKDKEIAKLTPTVKEEVELTVGSIEKTNNVYKSLAKEVDAKAFPQPKK